MQVRQSHHSEGGIDVLHNNSETTPILSSSTAVVDVVVAASSSSSSLPLRSLSWYHRIFQLLLPLPIIAITETKKLDQEDDYGMMMTTSSSLSLPQSSAVAQAGGVVEVPAATTTSEITIIRSVFETTTTTRMKQKQPHSNNNKRTRYSIVTTDHSTNDEYDENDVNDKQQMQEQGQEQQQEQEQELYNNHPLEKQVTMDDSLLLEDSKNAATYTSESTIGTPATTATAATTATTATTAKTTEWQTFIHLLKGNVGPGCLSLPWAISQLSLFGYPTITTSAEDSYISNSSISNSSNYNHDTNNNQTTTSAYYQNLFFGTIAICFMSYWSSYNCWTIVKIKRYITSSLIEEQEQHDQEKEKEQEQEQEQLYYNNPHHKVQQQLYVEDHSITRVTSASDTSSSIGNANRIRTQLTYSTGGRNHGTNNDNNKKNITFPDLGQWAYGDTFRTYTITCIAIQQLAVCTVFFSFIGENLYAAIHHHQHQYNQSDAQSNNNTITSSSSSSSSTSSNSSAGSNGWEWIISFISEQFQRMDHVGVMTVCLPFIMGLSCIRSLKRLAPVVAFGTILLFATFAVLLFVIIVVLQEQPEARQLLDELTTSTTTSTTADKEMLEFGSSNNGTAPADTNNFHYQSPQHDGHYRSYHQLKQIPLGLCAILYSFEGICLVLPVESVMEHPEKFYKVFIISMITVTILLTGVATSCVAAFGSVSNGSVTAYLIQKYQSQEDQQQQGQPQVHVHVHSHPQQPEGSSPSSLYILGWLHVANTAASFSVLFTYPLQLFPVMEVLGPIVVSYYDYYYNYSTRPSQIVSWLFQIQHKLIRCFHYCCCYCFSITFSNITTDYEDDVDNDNEELIRTTTSTGTYQHSSSEHHLLRNSSHSSSINNTTTVGYCDSLTRSAAVEEEEADYHHKYHEVSKNTTTSLDPLYILDSSSCGGCGGCGGRGGIVVIDENNPQQQQKQYPIKNPIVEIVDVNNIHTVHDRNRNSIHIDINNPNHMLPYCSNPTINPTNNPNMTIATPITTGVESVPEHTMVGDTLQLRATLVLITYLVAVLIPNVQALISVAGAVAGSSVALLIPPLLELAYIHDVDNKEQQQEQQYEQTGLSLSPPLPPPLQQRHLSSWWWGRRWNEKLKCYVLLFGGILFGTIGTIASVFDIIKILSSKP